MSPSIANMFPEEPLTLSAEEVLRKLGRGQFSSTWLASDSLAETLTYHAIKILTAHATKGHHDGDLFEFEAMQTITESVKSSVLPRMRDHFELMADTFVCSFMHSAPSKLLDPPKAKVIIAEVVEALVKLHAANIIHTDVKPDNVLFWEGTDPKSIKTFLDESPQVPDGEFELNGVRYPIMRSQPIPHPFKWNDPGITVELYSVCLTDFGSGTDSLFFSI
ncbi:hypothetical protein AZE42_03002 [Rhizopogon vesiculosus]|uniref:Protein kinase domain-containing protein n=1 Tax=Rhizopogon vesiculosus TaxID=180088 RepID=A0A1J8PGQ2_9AGAM|nr:hypothetical protein AZE42_03002 [Rhizopogon vesiculosus]